MESVNRFNHAHSQAPWRIQRQWVSVFLFTVLGFGIIATLYLTVTSQAAIIGREIQDLRLEIIETEHKNADLQTELALLTSKDTMEKRAYALGFRPIEPGELEYLYVPGYVAPKALYLQIRLICNPRDQRCFGIHPVFVGLAGCKSASTR